MFYFILLIEIAFLNPNLEIILKMFKVAAGHSDESGVGDPCHRTLTRAGTCHRRDPRFQGVNLKPSSNTHTLKINKLPRKCSIVQDSGCLRECSAKTLEGLRVCPAGRGP